MRVKKGKNFLETDKKEEEKPKEFHPLTKTYWPQFINHKNLKAFWFIVFSLCFVGLGFLYVKHFVLKKRKVF